MPFSSTPARRMRFDGEQRRGDPGLHVAGAAPVDPAVRARRRRTDRASTRRRRGRRRSGRSGGRRVMRATAPGADDVDAGMGGGVFGPALGGVKYSTSKPHASSRSPIELCAVVVRVAGRIDGRNANQLRCEGDVSSAAESMAARTRSTRTVDMAGNLEMQGRGWRSSVSTGTRFRCQTFGASDSIALASRRRVIPAVSESSPAPVTPSLFSRLR